MGVEIQLFEVGLTALNFSVRMNEKRNLQRKFNTRDELVARIMNSAALSKQELLDDFRRAHIPLPRELKSVLKSMVGFLNTYFELLQFIETIYLTNKCNQ
jgi:hypothetical protein